MNPSLREGKRAALLEGKTLTEEGEEEETGCREGKVCFRNCIRKRRGSNSPGGRRAGRMGLG